ncbi:MAG: 4Fe-4S binding protein, partial [Christensenellaceae bacterium]|nr:4Fe-4S binding protein [Christensenellaceae bacterium]
MELFFDTSVQKIKYLVFKEVARLAFEDKLADELFDIPARIRPGPQATLRCCIYKERVIVSERVHMAMGGDKRNPNLIEVLKTACDECPITQINVTEACRGCVAHHCKRACPKGAISIVNHRAVVDPELCVGCEKCVSVCP